jgi:hypothetical protein
VSAQTSDQTPLLDGPMFNAADGPFPIPMTENGRKALSTAIEHIASGEYDFVRSPCLCGAVHERLVCTVDRYRIPHRTVLCLECGLIRTDPRWTRSSYNGFYRHHYRAMYERPGHGAETIFDIQAVGASGRAALILRHVPVPMPLKVCDSAVKAGGTRSRFRDAVRL